MHKLHRIFHELIWSMYICKNNVEKYGMILPNIGINQTDIFNWAAIQTNLFIVNNYY